MYDKQERVVAELKEKEQGFEKERAKFKDFWENKFENMDKKKTSLIGNLQGNNYFF